MKMTSAYANKLLKSLTDEKSYWEAKEADIPHLRCRRRRGTGHPGV